MIVPVTACKNNITNTDSLGNAKNVEFLDDAVELGMNMPTPSAAEDIKSIIQSIDDRVSWINELLGNRDKKSNYHADIFEGFTYKESEVYGDYYDSDTLVYREGNEYYDKIKGGVFYYLYYDKEGHLIYADILQYRHSTYCIYFNRFNYDDTVICIIKGERTNKAECFFDEYMINAMRLCFENAYTDDL